MMTKLELHRVVEQLNEQIQSLSEHLLGQSNPHLSTAQQLRFGSNGSIAVEIAGAKRGQWYELVRQVLSETHWTSDPKR